MADPLLRAWNFEVSLEKSAALPAGLSGTARASGSSDSNTTLGDGSFQDCTGLEVEMDVQEYLEGGRNDGVIRRVGRAKYQNVVLKRGMFHASGGEVNRELWQWLQDVVSGVRPVVRFDGVIQVRSTGENVVAVWRFDRGLPARVKGPELNAKTGEIAIEELHIAHEGLRLVEV